jgi:hypothetical protein
VHRGRRCLPWLLVAVLGALAAGAAALGAVQGGPLATPKPPGAATQAPVTGFGGYVTVARTTEIAARWRVPTITAGSPPGHASTWIGVSTADSAHFIQVGTLEDKDRLFPAGPATLTYSAFWSDTDLTFHPHDLGTVHPGDEVSALMVQTPGGWRLEFRDPASHLSVVLPTAYGAGKVFSVPQWLQEDPSHGPPPIHNVPYPDMSDVHFSTVRLDRKVPDLTFGEAQALATTSGVFLVPSHFVDDGFTMAPADAAQSDYLRGALRYDDALRNLQLALSPTHAYGSRSAALGALARTVAAFDADLSSERWPPAAVQPVKQLESGGARMAEFLYTWLSGGASPSATRLRTFLRDAAQDHLLADAVRAALGLPPA